MRPPILLVDDCSEERAMIACWLEEAGHSVDLAADADEALAKLRANQPLILILASPLNRGDAREVLRRAKADSGWCDPAVILLTGEEGQPSIQYPAERTDVHLPKPISRAELVRFIERILACLVFAE